MRFRRLSPTLLFAALTATAPCAASPLIAPQTLQCDGTYASGGNTHTPNPVLQAVVTDSVGLRSNANPAGVPWRMGAIPVAGFPTRALWHFDSTVGTSPRACLSSGCPGGGAKCMRFDFIYSDPNGSDPVTVGQCFYNNPSGDCTPTGGTSTGLLPSSWIPVNLSTCPAAPPANPTALFTPSGLFSYAGDNTAVLNATKQQYGDIPFTGTWNLGADYTLSAWIKTANGTNGGLNQRILSEQGAQGYWGFGLSSAGALRSFDSRDALLGTADQSKGANIADNAWHQIHIVRRNGIDRRFYVDGKLVGSVTAVSSTSFTSNPIAANPQVGRYGPGNSEFFYGSINDLRVTDYKMTDDDVLLEYVGSVHKFSSDGGVTYSTAVGSWSGAVPANSAQGGFTYVPGETVTLANAANLRWIFEAQSTETVSSVLSPFQVVIDQSKPIPPPLIGTPTSANDITWSWGTPPRFCAPPGSASVFYDLIDCAAGGVVNPPGNVAYTGATGSVGEHIAGTPNQLRCRDLIVTDTWGQSPLSAPTSAYTLANTPTTPVFASISTGGFVVSWGQNGNPPYTRYEVTYSPDNFALTVATAESLGQNFTGSSVGVGGLTPGTTYYVRVRAFSGSATDTYGGLATPFATANIVSQPAAPSLSGTPLSNSAVLWSWSAVSGAQNYTLYDSGNGLPIFSGAALSVSTSASLSVNTRYAAEIEADPPPPSPPSAHGTAFTFTLANPPASLAASSLNPSSATFAWNPNGNPLPTFYQLVVATDATYGVVVATLTVSTPTATATNLLPGAVYYARVQAINGVQIPTAFATLAAPFTTPTDPKITSNQAPATPYSAASNLVGSWQFDEGAGLSVGDLSASQNSLQLGCVISGCASTPTFVAGPPGLGTAGSFTGLSGVALSASAAPFAFADSLTVEAWVNPQTASQPSGAGLVAAGSAGAEDFALDMSAGVYRFLASNGKVAASTTPVSVGVWTHVAGVFDSAAQTAALYVNGAPVASAAPPVPLRTNSGQVLAVGNRKSALGSYSLPFFGLVDDVRVFHAALSPAQIQTEYQGGFVSTVTPTAPNAKVLVGLPPNAFGAASAQIYVSADPLAHPIRIPIAALTTGLASTPQGLVMLPGSLTEIVPIVSGLPFALPLGSSATVTLPYTDVNGDGLVDGTNPPLSAALIQMYTLNTTVNRWEPLATSVDLTRTRVTGLTPHFSVFALFAPLAVAPNLLNVKVYPVPWKPGTGGRFDAAGVTFANLPASGSIRILSLDGRRVRDFGYNGASAGAAVWDGLNNDGKRAASGVYFAKVSSDADGSSVLLKFAIER